MLHVLSSAVVEASPLIIVKPCRPPQFFKLIHKRCLLQVVLPPIVEASADVLAAANVLDPPQLQNDAATNTPTQLTAPHRQSKASLPNYSYPDIPTTMLNLKFSYIRHLRILTSMDYPNRGAGS